MGLYTVTILGFSVCIAISGFAILHYFAKGMNSHDAIQVDPKPSK